MPRYKLTLEYNGTGTIGWQKQPGYTSLQHLLERALLAFCGTEVEAVAAGRTDAGVHALGQVAHVDMPRVVDPYSLMQGVNYHLYQHTGDSDETRRVPALAVVNAVPVPEDFHARFSAVRRTYVYRIVMRPARPVLEAGRVWHVPVDLDVKAMQHAAQALCGTHDFTSFRDTECQAKSPVKTLDTLAVQRVSPEEIQIHAVARSFLHHQVRILTGTLRAVGQGKLEAGSMPAILAAKARAAAGPTAPPEGLYLVRVEYAPTPRADTITP